MLRRVVAVRDQSAQEHGQFRLTMRISFGEDCLELRAGSADCDPERSSCFRDLYAESDLLRELYLGLSQAEHLP